MTRSTSPRAVAVACLLALVGCGGDVSLPDRSPGPAVDDEGDAGPLVPVETGDSGGPGGLIPAAEDDDHTDPGPTAPVATVTPAVDDPAPAASGLPGFVATGTRMTWYAAAASVAQTGFSITEDPTCSAGGPGCYTDPQTGKFYRKSDEGPDAQGAPTASGDGYSQLDVMAIDGRNVALMSNLYTIDRTFDQLGWTPLGGATINGTSLDGSWLPPAELEQAVANGVGGVMVLAGEYQFGDQLVPSVSFVTGLGSANYQSQTFDRRTGILLSSNGSIAGATTPFTVEGRATPVTGNTQLTMTRLVSVRDRTLPGQDAPVPEWVAGTSTLAYAGNYNWTNPIDSSAGSLDYPMQHTVSFAARTPMWASYTTRTLVPGLAEDTTTPGVGGGVGFYWWDPQALAGFSEGQTLDEDPVTGERLFVSYRGPSPNGTEVVTIASQMPGVETQSTFDMTGLLVAYQVWHGSIGATITVELVQRG
jgi:hypothetical protein